MDLERRPEFDQLRPKTVALIIGCLARVVFCRLLPDLKLGDRMTAEIDYPGICPLSIGSDIANDNCLTITQVEYRGCTILSRPATFRGQK
jgi:hypothetical protein